MTWDNNTNADTKRAQAPFKLQKDVQIVLGLDFIMVVVAFLLHILGICLLIRQGLRNISKQSIILIHMSLVSMLNIVDNAIAIYWKLNGTRFRKDFIVIYYIAHMAYILNLCLLSLDRIAFVAYPFRYRAKMTKFIIFSALGILWIPCIIFGLMIKLGGMANPWFNKYASYIYNGCVILFSICVYIFIIYKAYYSTIKRYSKKTKKLFIMPLLIVLTFFMFTFLPHAIAYNVKFTNKYTKNLVILALIGMNVANNISDVIIYILLHPQAYKRLKELCHRLPKIKPASQRYQYENRKKDSSGTFNTKETIGTISVINGIESKLEKISE